MKARSQLSRKATLEQVREVKVVIFFGRKVCNPFVGKVCRSRERKSDVRFDGRREI